MDDTKTVSSDIDLYVNQTRDVANMRAALLNLNKSDPNAARRALQNITVLRVYHQISRIIRYTELMDRIEDKMYESIGMDLDAMDSMDPSTWRTLVSLQAKLQESMIESHKLLEPYLKLESLTSIDIPQEVDPTTSFTAVIMDQESREKIRTSAQEVLTAIAKATEITDSEDAEE